METGWIVVFVAAQVAAWLVLGRGWGAAFRSPVVVLLPVLSLILAHAMLFDNFFRLPPIALGILWVEVCALFLLTLLYSARPQAEAEIVSPVALRSTYLLKEGREPVVAAVATPAKLAPPAWDIVSRIENPREAAARRAQEKWQSQKKLFRTLDRMLLDHPEYRGPEMRRIEAR